MKRFVKVCIGSTALALGVAVAPVAALAGPAAQAATSTTSPPGQFHSQQVTLSAPRQVDLRALGHSTGTQHPDLVPPFRYFNPAGIATERAAVARSGGRRSGVTALSGSQATAQAVGPAQTWADFPVMSLSRQISLFGNDQAVQPPDTQVAAGPGAVADATNDSLSVWSKTGALLAVADLNQLFRLPSGFSFSDPRVVYDTQSGRWFLSGFGADAAFNSIPVLAVSTTSKPAGNWTVFDVTPQTTSTLTDQPMLGVCDDKVVMSWDNFDSSGTFLEAQTMVLQKSDLTGATGVAGTSLTSPNESRLVPAQSLSSTTTCWMTVNNSDPTNLGGPSSSPTLGVIAITGTPAANNVALSETDLAVTKGTSLPPTPAQPSGTTNDTALDDRLLSAVWRNGVLWTSGTDACTPAGDTATRDCSRLWEVNTAGAAPSLTLDTDLSKIGTDLYYPAVSLDSPGNLFVAYSASSSTLTPGAYAAISPAASAGTFSAPVTIAAGAASYNGGTYARWGDYSAAAPDPSAPGAVWVAGEYAPSNAAQGYWGTAVAQISLSAPAAPAAAVGIEGTNGALTVQAPQLGSGWHSLGGKIVAPPAVASVPNPYGSTPSQPLFIGTGTNTQLYMRSLTVGWQPVGPAKASCIGGPAAVVAGNTITLACRGLNNALWVDTATVPSSGLPQFTNAWSSLGGVLTTAPAVAPVGGAMTFFVRGSNGGIYTRTLASGYSHTPWSCIGAPAAAVEEASIDTIFACQGTNHALWVAVNGGNGWGGASSLGGGLVGGPAIAATSRVPEFLIEGTNHAVWERTVTGGWFSLGSSANGGVGADALN